MAVNGHTSRTLTVRQAAFIGVGAMVGAGIFSLLGAAGEVAGAAVWLSFLIAGAIALLQGYSFAKFGARYPSAAGLLEYVVLTILTLFAVTTLANLDLDLLAFSGYPPVRDIVSSVALTFFAFLGFGVVTFTAKDLADPSRQLPRAIFLALGIATIIYVAVALGVFGTLTVDKVVSSGATALAVAAEPVLGRAGYWLMSVTALFSTAGATNAGLYPAAGLSEQMASIGQFPPVLGRRFGGRAPAGLLVTAAVAIVLATGFDLSSIASLGSAIALLVFTLVTAAHFRVRGETGASTLVLGMAITSTIVVLLTFAFTTLVDEPATAAALAVILLLSVALDVGWKRTRDGRIPSR
jgi:amino acid transporter